MWGSLSRDTMLRPAPGRRRRHQPQAELPHPTSACPTYSFRVARTFAPSSTDPHRSSSSRCRTDNLLNHPLTGVARQGTRFHLASLRWLHKRPPIGVGWSRAHVNRRLIVSSYACHGVRIVVNDPSLWALYRIGIPKLTILF